VITAVCTGVDRGYRTLLPAALAYDPDLDDGGAGRVRRSIRDWLVDVTIFLLAILLGGFAFIDAVETGVVTSPTQQFLDLVAGAAACLALWWRRRWPVGIWLALLPVSTFSTSSAGATAALLFTIAIRRRFAVVAIVTVLSILALPAYFAIVGPGSGGYLAEATISILLTLVVVGWGMMVRARRQLVMSLRERALRAESEQQLRVEQARHHERERIAREMHDVLAHRISLLSVHAGALEFRPDAPPEEIAAAAGVIRASAHQALQDLREVISVLRGDASGGDIGPARPQPTIVDLPELVEESRLAGMRVELTNGIADLGAVPSSVGRGAYRIVQEGLTNARKHAPGTAVVVRVGGEAGDGIDIELRNRWPDGATSDIPGAGAGLVGLTERVSLAGGRIEHGRTPDGEFRLHAWLPWPA
jgi:signal transduction histidine kinase